MKHLHALLVGINAYSGKPLGGCVNDARAWQGHLEEWFGTSGRLSLAVLHDEDATRRRILDAFRSHLGAAREGDTALFCFSGHGSQEPAPLPYSLEEPGGLSETLLAHDSRGGGLDIADKELAVLIAELARGGAHIVVVLDSCHSGTATREPEEEGLVRRMAGSRYQRPAGSYWFQEEGAAVPAELDSAGGWRVLPAGRHVLLSACEDYQTAKECTVPDGTKRGLFSYHLLSALEQLGPRTTYRELFKRVQTRVNNQIPDQRPQAEGELDRLLFDGAIAPRPARFHVSRREDGTWWLDAGAVHAVQPGTELAVLPAGAPEAEADVLAGRLGTARVAEVGAGSSRLEVTEGELPAEPPVHPAVVTHLPLPPVRVALEGRSSELAALRGDLDASPYLALAEGPAGADLIVVREAGRWRLRRPGAAGDLVDPRAASAVGTAEMIEALEHVARWQTLAELSSPGSPLFDALQMTVWEWLLPPGPGLEAELGPLPAAGEILLPYRETDGSEPLPGRICVHLENRGEKALYYALLALDETFAVSLVEGGTGRLAGGAEVWVRRGAGIPGTVPDRYHARGVTRRRDLLVLLVSAVETDFSVLEQRGIFEPSSRGIDRAPREGGPGLLEALLRRVARRELDDAPRVAHQWAAKSQAVASVRPMPWRRLAGDGRAAELVPGVRLRAPAGLAGAVRLRGLAAAPGFPGLAGLPVEERPRLRPVALAGALGSDPGLSALELRLDDWERVSEADPLVLETDLALRAGEVLAAVSWDGRESRLMPGGGEGTATGSCSIPSVPAPAAGSDTTLLELYALRSGG
ncbi:MAG TPA: caspase family protein [Thermoanaerobaculia bacterium]|nr:caspase family protein [Thermoanaerobaculia bacterium]